MFDGLGGSDAESDVIKAHVFTVKKAVRVFPFGLDNPKACLAVAGADMGRALIHDAVA